MKQSPEDKILIEKLGPSAFSGEGFLGNDKRTPTEIITEDKHALSIKNIGIEKVAELLEDAYNSGIKTLGGEIEISSGITAVYYESMGKIPSPFTGEGTFPKGEVIVKDNVSGKKLILTSLSIHLIRKHGFFQGKGSRYRIEPDDIIEIFKIK